MPSIRSALRLAAAAGAAVAVAVTTAAPASAMAIGQPLCNHRPSAEAYVCVQEVADGPRIPVAPVYGATTSPVGVADLAGYLVSYRVPTGPQSFADIPCVVQVTNGVTTDECASLGLARTPDRQPVTLYHQPVNSYTAGITQTSQLYICEASVTATADGFGITNQILPTLCYDGLLEQATKVVDALIGPWST